MAIDFCKRDWIDDTDLLLSRVAMEFPRISNKYQSKHHDQIKPWGDISEPVLLETKNDDNLLRFSTGFNSMPNIKKNWKKNSD